MYTFIKSNEILEAGTKFPGNFLGPQILKIPSKLHELWTDKKQAIFARKLEKEALDMLRWSDWLACTQS